MGLIDLQTDLKSLKFGKDRFGGGDSGQPFIKTPIIEEPGKLAKLETEDFLLRGGVRAPLRALEDVVRLTKYVFNPKSPSGLLFILKQNLLSRVAVKTEASGKILNGGIYTPLSTLAQAGVGFLGIHLNKQGLDPTGLISALSIKTYESIVGGQNVGNFEKDNRLVKILSQRQKIKPLLPTLQNNVLTYGGGPGSILGIGKTKIKFADQRTGVNNPNYKASWPYARPQVKYNIEKIFKGESISGTVSSIYSKLTGTQLDKLVGNYVDQYKLPQDSYSVYEKGTLNLNKALIQSTPPPEKTKEKSKIGYPKLFGASKKTNTTLNPNYTSPRGIDPKSNYNPSTPSPTDKITNTFTNLQNNYRYTLNQQEVNNKQGQPYQAGVSSNQIVGERVGIGSPGSQKGSRTRILDKLNSLTSIYRTNLSVGGHTDDYNDLCHFRIGIIDPENPKNVTYMNFRSYINSFSDSYGADWKSQQYMGRGEKFYKYQSFKRDISLSFTIVAQSQAELNGMYKKLNYLASSLAPKYTTAGFMAGNLAKLTVGDYVFEQTGFISSLTYDIPTESPWEIDIDGDPNNDELPFIINVTGLKFTPIHKFRPEVGYQNRFITHNLGSVTTKPGPQKGRETEIEDRQIAIDKADAEAEAKIKEEEERVRLEQEKEIQMLENLAKAKEIEEANVITEEAVGIEQQSIELQSLTSNFASDSDFFSSNYYTPTVNNTISTPPPTADDPPTTSFLQVPIGNGGIVVNPFYVPFNP